MCEHQMGKNNERLDLLVKIRKVSLPVKIMRFPTVADRGSRYATDAMAKVGTVLLDLLPWLPQTSLSAPARVKDSGVFPLPVCALN